MVDALSRAMSHVGSHIVDLRATTPLSGISEYETAAWHVTVFSAFTPEDIDVARRLPRLERRMAAI